MKPFLLLTLAMLALCGCDDKSSERFGLRAYHYGACEYLRTFEGALVHRGDCPNPVHKQSVSDVPKPDPISPIVLNSNIVVFPRDDGRLLAVWISAVKFVEVQNRTKNFLVLNDGQRFEVPDFTVRTCETIWERNRKPKVVDLKNATNVLIYQNIIWPASWPTNSTIVWVAGQATNGPSPIEYGNGELSATKNPLLLTNIVNLSRVERIAALSNALRYEEGIERFISSNKLWRDHALPPVFYGDRPEVAK